MKVEEFNPIKEDRDGVRAKRVIWSTKSLNSALKALEEGRKLVANPFYENNTRLLKADLVFKRTPEEVEEWKKCATDIIYFANKYCKLMTPEGVKSIELRDYQVDYLKQLMDNQMNIMLSARQAGKCLTYLSIINCKVKDSFIENLDDNLKKRWKDLFYIKESDTYNLPLFELYNVFDKRLIWKVKYQLYKIIYRLCQKDNS